MNVTTMITVRGTKKSELGFGLDDGEISRFTIKPGEYDRRLSSISDIVSHIAESAYMRGEWVSSLVINDVDLVRRFIDESRARNNGDFELILRDLSAIPLFSHADIYDLTALVFRRIGESMSE